jgi:peptide deformylase
MTVREILKMGDARLLRQAQAIQQFNTPELLQGIADMKETMLAANGAGLAAPQIGWDVQLSLIHI